MERGITGSKAMMTVPSTVPMPAPMRNPSRVTGAPDTTGENTLMVSARNKDMKKPIKALNPKVMKPPLAEN